MTNKLYSIDKVPSSYKEYYENNKKNVVDHAFQYSCDHYDILLRVLFGMVSYHGFICLGTFY